MDGRWGREISRWLNNDLVDTDGLHAVDRALKLLKPLGIRSPEVRFDVPAGTPDNEAAARLIHDLGLDGGFVLVASGAGWSSKLWPVDRHAAVAAWLGRRWNLPSLLVWGNATECERAEAIIAAAEGHAVLCPKVTLLQLAAVARRARFALGGDTGPLHLAAAAGGTVYWPVWSVARRQAWSVRATAHQPAEGQLARHDEAAAARADHVSGGHRCGFGV